MSVRQCRPVLAVICACLVVACATAAGRGEKVSAEEGAAFEARTIEEWRQFRERRGERDCISPDLLERLGVVERRACREERRSDPTSLRTCFEAQTAQREALQLTLICK
jgi:hypothetical protein